MTSPGNLLNNWPACKKILRRMPIGEPGRGMELGDGDEACHPASLFSHSHHSATAELVPTGLPKCSLPRL